MNSRCLVKGKDVRSFWKASSGQIVEDLKFQDRLIQIWSTVTNSWRFLNKEVMSWLNCVLGSLLRYLYTAGISNSTCLKLYVEFFFFFLLLYILFFLHSLSQLTTIISAAAKIMLRVILVLTTYSPITSNKSPNFTPTIYQTLCLALC